MIALQSTVAPPLRVLGWPAFTRRAHQPYTAVLYDRMAGLGVEVEEFSPLRALSGRYSVLHLHWPDRRPRAGSALEAMGRSAAMIALLDAVRRRGTKVVWTAHNLEAHDGPTRPWLEPRYWRALAQRLDGVLSLAPSTTELLHERHPEMRAVPTFVTPHAHYRGAYPDAVDRRAAREALGLAESDRVIGFVGQIRPYKGLLTLVNAFRGVGDPHARLLLAGATKPASLAGEIAAAAADDPRVRLDPGFVPGERLQLYLRAADVVVLPYREILNSGSAILALSFDRPVLVPGKGTLRDLAQVAGPDWVRTYAGELDAAALAGALAWATAPDRPFTPLLDALDPWRVARMTVEAYRAIGA